MRNKIQKSMLVVICATVVSAFIIMAVLFYAYSLNHMKKELKQEMSYIVTAMEISGATYLDDIDAARVETRLTLIDETGEVLYDSKEDDYTFQSHAEREEIESALMHLAGIHKIKNRDCDENS